MKKFIFTLFFCCFISFAGFSQETQRKDTIIEYNFSKDLGRKFKVLDENGKVLMEGITNIKLFSSLPHWTLLILEIEGFAPFKICKAYDK